MSGCRGCVYWRGLNGKGSKVRVCHFLLDTKQRRGCEPGEGCTRRKTCATRRRAWTDRGEEELRADDGEGMAEART